MARGLWRKGKKVQRNPELEMKAEEFLDEKRVLDGEERFWSDESEVRLLRILAVEEGVASSQDSKTGKNCQLGGSAPGMAACPKNSNRS